MSVLVPDPGVYEYIHTGLKFAAYRTVCDDLYSDVIRSHFRDKDTEKEAKRLVKLWCELNELSWCARYNEPFEVNMYTFIKWGATHILEGVQLCKYLQCVIYNIELSTIESKGRIITNEQNEAYKLLRDWYISLMAAIIKELPAYKTAHWQKEPA